MLIEVPESGFKRKELDVDVFSEKVVKQQHADKGPSLHTASMSKINSSQTDCDLVQSLAQTGETVIHRHVWSVQIQIELHAKPLDSLELFISINQFISCSGPVPLAAHY